jgi:drug/metabolite transporter (DMT)-like permease
MLLSDNLVPDLIQNMPRSSGFLPLALLALLWGTMVPAIAELLGVWDPYFLACFRYAGAFPLLWLAIQAMERGGGGILASLMGWRIWVLGVVGIGLFSALFTVGIGNSHPVTAAILAATGPAIAAIVDRLLFAVPLDRRMIPAILLSFIGGVLATVDFSGGDFAFDFRGGEILIILAIGCWAWYSAAAQRWFKHWSQLRITAASATTAGIGLIPVYLAAAALGAAQFPPAAPRGMTDILLLLWVTWVLVAFGVVLWNLGVKRAGIVGASLYLNLTPVVAVGIFAIGGQFPNPTQIVGGLMVILGVVMSEIRMLKSKRPDQALDSVRLS